MKNYNILFISIFLLCFANHSFSQRWIGKIAKSKTNWTTPPTKGSFVKSTGPTTTIDGVKVNLGAKTTPVVIQKGKDNNGNTTDLLWGNDKKSVSKSGAGHEHAYQLNTKKSGSSMNDNPALRQSKNRPNWDSNKKITPANKVSF